MDKIAIIGSGTIAKIFSERARELNIESHCFSWDKHDVACTSVDFFHEVNIFDIEKITHICKDNEVNGIIATTELTILPAAKVANLLGLNGNRVQVAEEITNKYLTRNKVAAVSGLNQPKYWISTDGTVPNVDRYPVIVKPVAAGGKRGICVIDSVDKIGAAIREAALYSKVNGVLVEEYLAGGTEYSVESLSYGGKHYVIQVTQKDSSGPPHCNELGHHQPADLSLKMRSKVENVVSDMLTAVGIEYGPSHTEIKIIDGEIFLIEINGRPGGDHITYPLTELSTGYPFVSGIIWIAIGKFEGHEPTNLKHHFSGICFITDKTSYLEPLFKKCESYPWLYKKNQVNDGLSKIVFNDEENLNYFIYYSKNEKPDIQGLAR